MYGYLLTYTINYFVVPTRVQITLQNTQLQLEVHVLQKFLFCYESARLVTKVPCGGYKSARLVTKVPCGHVLSTQY